MDLLRAREAKQKKFQVDLRLTPAQQEIDRGFRRFTFVRAGRKFGKTVYARKKVLDWLGPPNSCVWLISPTYRQGKLIAWADLKRTIPPEALQRKPNDSELTFTLKNGSELYLMGSDEPDSLRGPAPTGVVFEEAAYHKAEAWHDVIRPNLTVHKAPALFISSPNGFNWFKDLEDEAIARIESGDTEWATFHKTIYDNPYIDREEIDKIKLQCDPRVWSQEYMANYESSIGRVFHEFQDTSRHVRNFPQPASGEPCFRAIDWGMRDDTACLWAVARDKLYVYRENADNGLPPKAQAEIIKARTSDKESIEMNIIGHDAAKMDTEMRGLTVQWHFQNAGIRPLRLSSKNKNASRAIIQELISQDKLVIHPECRKLRKQLLSYSWKDTARETTDDGNDDLCDAMHYLAELVQYRMFLSRPKEETREERLRKAVADMEAQRKPRYPIVPKETGDIPNFENTPAGYF